MQEIQISVQNQKWSSKNITEKEISYIVNEFQVSEILAQILLQKNIPLEELDNYLNPKLKNLISNPNDLLDMTKAVERIVTAIKQNQKITIWGDYDVDGATSTALFLKYFRKIGADVSYYIPDRIKEGYGPNKQGIKQLIESGTKLIITVDCGTLSHETLESFKEEVDIIIVDHHISDITLPPCYALINPNRFDENSPYKYLAAVGVVFLVLVALNNKLKQEQHLISNLPDLMIYLDIVALGTVCDVVPLTQLNRAFVAQGLKVMASFLNTGICALAKVANLNKAPTSYDLGYILGPRINAGGRVGLSSLGAELLATDDISVAQDIAIKLDEFNKERRLLEQHMIEEALEFCAQSNDLDNVIVAYSEKWHQGIIGIVAGRLKEKYNKPVAILSITDGIGKASCRSVNGFDFGSAVIEAKNGNIILQGGGHAMAAGFSIEAANIPNLKKFLNNKYALVRDVIESKNIKFYSAKIKGDTLNFRFIDEIAKLAPFGAANSEPKFLLENIKVIKVNIIGEFHLKLILVAENSRNSLKATAFKVIGSDLGNFLLNATGEIISLIGYIRPNHWNGSTTIDFIIEDVIK
jgi:single-stranded-DNA-specific exonuclease